MDEKCGQTRLGELLNMLACRCRIRRDGTLRLTDAIGVQVLADGDGVFEVRWLRIGMAVRERCVVPRPFNGDVASMYGFIVMMMIMSEELEMLLARVGRSGSRRW